MAMGAEIRTGMKNLMIAIARDLNLKLIEDAVVDGT
jgi:hypothetical protein